MLRDIMKIVFVIGGAKSGKSSFALKEASGVDGRKAYIATAEALDDEMKKRIENHKIERDGDWDTFEEPVDISGVLPGLQAKYGAVLLDCLTIWLSNVLLRGEISSPDHETPDESIDGLVSCLVGLNGMSESVLYIVSNEVGAGIVPENKLARRFRDLAGSLNQKVAEIADEVYLVAAGIPIKIKDQK